MNKLPRKSSKSDSMSTSSGCTDNAGAQRSSSLNDVSNRSSVAVKRMSSAVFPSNVVSGIEPFLSFKGRIFIAN